MGGIAALVPEFAVKDLPLGGTLMMMTINSSREKVQDISTILTIVRNDFPESLKAKSRYVIVK